MAEQQVAIVTGANKGLGFYISLGLAQKGFHVILACRDEKKGKAAVNEIKSKIPNAHVEEMSLDTSNLSSVRKFASEFKNKNLPLHLLINNAGILAIKDYTLSVDGYELAFATNYLGHFLLTNLLLDIMKKSSHARIINHSSTAHYSAGGGVPPEGGKLNFDRYKILYCLTTQRLAKYNDPKEYQPYDSYALSKMAQISHAKELQRKLLAEGVKNVIVHSTHPGVVDTELWTLNNTFTAQMVADMVHTKLLTAEEGAETTLFVATDPSVAELRGEFWDNKKVIPPAKDACDEEVARKLWEYSESLCL